MGAGAQRLAFYTSCFTDNYQDVCAKLKEEDVRFVVGVTQLVKNRNVIFLMVRIYIELLLKKQDERKIANIQRSLMSINVNISTKFFTKEAFITALTTTICLSFKSNSILNKNSNKIATIITASLSYSGLVQQSADCANRLKSFNSVYYAALYARNLEMMYFIIEPIIKKTPLSSMISLSDYEIVDLIKSMMR